MAEEKLSFLLRVVLQHLSSLVRVFLLLQSRGVPLENPVRVSGCASIQPGLILPWEKPRKLHLGEHPWLNSSQEETCHEASRSLVKQTFTWNAAVGSGALAAELGILRAGMAELW